MPRPARPARAAAQSRAAQRLLKKGSRRLLPHTPLHTRKPTQHRHNAWAGRSVSVLVLRHQRQRRLEKNVEIEQHRPVLDIIEIELDPLLDLLFAVDFAAPAIDLDRKSV